MTDPQVAASLEFLEALRPAGGWALVAIDDSGRVEGRTFGPGDREGLEKWVSDLNGERPRMNVYVHVNPLGRPVPKKATKEDVAAVEWLHVDIDPDPGEDIGRERERILDALRRHPGTPAPTAVVFSGGGYWGLWRLREPIVLDGPEAVERAEALNRGLERAFGGDGCANVDRIMRLPGTVNWPNEKKRKRGQEPTVAGVVEIHADRIYGVEEFEPAGEPSGRRRVAAAAPVDAKPVPVELDEAFPDDPDRVARGVARWLVVHGCETEVTADLFREGLVSAETRAKWTSRSEPQFFATCEMLRAGMTDGQVLGVLCGDYGISRSVKLLPGGAGRRGWDRYARRQVENARGAVEAEGREWEVDGKGAARKTPNNFQKALAELGVRFEYDEFEDQVVIHGMEGFGPRFDEHALVRLRFTLGRDKGVVFAKDMLADLCLDEALNHRRHPVREFLEEAEESWDGVERLDSWMVRYLGAEDSEYVRAVSRLVLTAAVRRVRRPGCKFDELVVLEGRQGIGKSMLLRRLSVVAEWFTDDLPLNADGKRVIEQTRGKWIVECGELAGMRKSEIEALKSTLSRQRDRARLAYARLESEVARQWVPFGSTNARHYLKDQTGNRRFLPVETPSVNLTEFTPEVVWQLWGEAAAAESAGESTRLSPDLYPAAALEQEQRTAEDPWFEALESALGGLENCKVPCSEVWHIVDMGDKSRRRQDHNVQIGQAMRRLGFERKTARVKPEGWTTSKTSKCYVRGHGTKTYVANLDGQGNFLGMVEQAF